MSGVERTELVPGYSISRLIKGGWHLAGGHGTIDRAQAIKDMAAFVEAGITTFDCADHYTGVEEMIGDFRAAYPELAKQLQVHTKIVPDFDRLAFADRTYIEGIVDRSLRRLRVERLDLLQYYWWDPDGFPAYVETGVILKELREAGKIAEIGVSNFNVAQLRKLVLAGVPIASNQPQYSPIDLRPEKRMIDYCLGLGAQQVCYGTLAGGFFSKAWLGKPEPGSDFDNRSLTKYKLIIDDFGGWALFQDLLKALARVADRHGATIGQVALRWSLNRRGVAAAIVGATSARHLAENIGVFDVALTPEDEAAIQSVIDRSPGLEGDCYDLERDKEGRHGSIMRYNQNASPVVS